MGAVGDSSNSKEATTAAHHDTHVVLAFIGSIFVILVVFVNVLVYSDVPVTDTKLI